MSAADITITSEAEAWALLSDALEGNLPEKISSLTFEGWPILEIKLVGEQFNSSLTTKMMQGFIDLQSNIYRAYADLYHNRSTGRLLTDQEKRLLEIVVRVDPGSSELSAALSEALTEFAKGVAKKVESKHVVYMVLGCALVWGGVTCWKSYLQNQKDRDVITQEAITKRFAGEKENERMRLLAAVAQKEPRLATAQESSEEVYNQVLKGSASAQVVKLAGHEIEQHEVRALIRKSRAVSKKVSLNGEYRVLKVDSSNPSHFKVDLQYQDGRKFQAQLSEAFFSTPMNKALIQTAEWDRQPILLMVDGTELHGQITTAKIIDVLDRYLE